MAENKQAESADNTAGKRSGTGRKAGVGGDAATPEAKAAKARGSTGKAANGSAKALDGATAEAGTGGRKPASRSARQPDLKKDLREFASARPQGWDHDDWLGFLESLQSRGHNISDREMIGLALEKERLHIALGGVKGIGPQKRQSLVDYYGNLWQLRHADPDEIARVGNLQAKDAERIKTEIR